MSIPNWLRPIPLKWRDIFNYPSFLVLVMAYATAFLFYFIWQILRFDEIVGMERVLLGAFLIYLVTFVYLGGQLLSLWLGPHQTRQGYWIVTLIGLAVSATAFLVMVKTLMLY